MSFDAATTKLLVSNFQFQPDVLDQQGTKCSTISSVFMRLERIDNREDQSVHTNNKQTEPRWSEQDPHLLLASGDNSWTKPYVRHFKCDA